VWPGSSRAITAGSLCRRLQVQYNVYCACHVFLPTVTWAAVRSIVLCNVAAFRQGLERCIAIADSGNAAVRRRLLFVYLMHTPLQDTFLHNDLLLSRRCLVFLPPQSVRTSLTRKEADEGVDNVDRPHESYVPITLLMLMDQLDKHTIFTQRHALKSIYMPQ
jgi:hypothetical protein